MCEEQSEPISFEVEVIIEDHETPAQELVTPLEEPTQCEVEVGLFNISHAWYTNSFIEVECIDFLVVDNFNWVMGPYLVHLVNNYKTKLIGNAQVVEL